MYLLSKLIESNSTDRTMSHLSTFGAFCSAGERRAQGPPYRPPHQAEGTFLLISLWRPFNSRSWKMQWFLARTLSILPNCECSLLLTLQAWIRCCLFSPLHTAAWWQNEEFWSPSARCIKFNIYGNLADCTLYILLLEYYNREGKLVSRSWE